MTALRDRQERTRTVLCLVGLFAALFFLCRLFPLVGDDWYREVLGASIHSPLDLIRQVAARWSATNSRILGNVLAFSAGSRPLLRELLRSSIILALIALLACVTRTGSWRGLLLWTAAALAIPQEIFCQIYPWAAGFFNYVPPVVLLLACLALVRPVLDGESLEETPGRWAALFLLAFGHQLFMEHDTLYALCAALVLLVWYRLERRSWSPSLLLLLLGCVLGGALLFASPAYRSIAGSGGDYYQSGLSGGLAGLIDSAQVNLPVVSRYLILDCPVLYGSLTLLTLPLGLKHRGWFHRLLAAALALSGLWLAWGGFRPFVAACVWALVLTLALVLWLPDRISRAWTLFFLFSAPVAAGPLLFVNPIGPRCLFLPYILLLAAAGCILRALEPGHLVPLLSGLVPAALAAAVLGLYFSVFLPIHQLELQRTRLLEEALASRASQVTIPAYADDGWLWDGNVGFKIEQRYCYTTPGDLAVSFSPSPQS